MSKEVSLILLGIWVIVVPYLGIPGSWRTALLALSGLAIAIIGFMLRAESAPRTRVSGRDPFVEHIPPSPDAVNEQKERLTSLN